MVAKARSGDPIAQLLQPQPSADPIARLVQAEVSGANSAFNSKSQLAEEGPYAPASLGEAFVRGVRGGTERLGADIAYFGAAWDAVTGDDAEKADAIENARIREEFSRMSLDGIGTLDDALENPSVMGFLEAAVSGVGQVTPQVASVIASAGVGSLAVAGAQGVLKGASRHAARNIIKDSVEATAKGTATVQQGRIAQASYEALKEAHVLQRNAFFQQRARKKGMLGGAFAAGYVPLTAGNVRDTLESDRPLDAIGALRSYAVAVPQTAIGLAGEVGLVALIGKEALKKSTGKNSVMGRLADVMGRGAGRGALVEGTAEYLQEEIAIQNRQSMDPDYTDAEANSRRLNALFLGTIAGGTIGAAGTGAVQGAREIANADITNNAISGAANIIEKAADMRDSIADLITRQRSTQETATAGSDQTVAESQRDIAAQLKAMFDPTSGKEAVWIAGTEPDERFANRDRPRKIFIDGKEAYSAFVPGRGTIISTKYDVVEAVVKGQASDAVLSAALGYSSVKTGRETEVVRVYDKDGGIVSEQAFEKENLSEALDAAKKLQPEGGRTEILDLEEALADRARRADPDVRFMDIDPDEEVDPMEKDQDTNEQVGDNDFESETRTHSFINAQGKRSESYKAVEGENTFKGIDEARQDYIEEFGDTDFTDPLFKRLSASILRTATKLQKANPDEIVSIRENADGTFRIDIETTPDTQKIRIRDGKGNESEVSLSEFIRQSLNKAASSKKEFRTFSIKAPGSEKFVNVNPVDLMNAGRRLMEALNPGQGFTGAGTVQSARQGMLAMLGELQLRGYEVEVKDVPIDVILEALAKPTPKNIKRLPKEIRNITLGFDEGGKKVGLEFLLRERSRGAAMPDLVEVELDGPQRQTVIETTGSDQGDFFGTGETTRTVEPFGSRGKPLGPNQKRIEVINYPDTKAGEKVTVDRETAAEIEQEQDGFLSTREGEIGTFRTESARTDDDIPLTTINIEDLRNVDTTQNRPKGSAPTMGPQSEKAPKRKPDLVGAVTFPFSGVADTVTAVARRLSRKVKLQTPLAVIGLKGFQDATRAQLAALVSPKKQKSAYGKRYLKGLETLDLSDKAAVGRFIRYAEEVGLLNKDMAKLVRKSKSNSRLGHSMVRRAAFEALSPMTESTFQRTKLADLFVDSFGKPNRKGFFKGYQGAGVVMVNDLHVDNEAAQAMAAAHEIGHALFREELDSTLKNKKLLERLMNRYRADTKKPSSPAQYDTESEVGFEEWYADQVAAWVKKDMLGDKRAAKDAVESHFKKVVRRFKQLWREARNTAIFRRTNTVSPEFSAYMDAVMETRKDKKEVIGVPLIEDGVQVATVSALQGARPTPEQDTEAALEAAAQNALTENRRFQARQNFGTGQINKQMSLDLPETEQAADTMPEPDEPTYEQKAVVGAIKEAINTQTGQAAREEQLRRFLRNMNKAFRKKAPWAADILKIVRTADGMLRMAAGDKIADMFYIRSNTRSGLGFTQERQLARDKWRAGLFEVLGADWTAEDVQAALKEAQSGKATTELEGKARLLREYLERFHNEYIEPSNTNIGFRENYFPVLLELAEVTNDPQAFMQIIVDANKKAGVETDMKALEKSVNKLIKYQGIVDEGGKPSDVDILDPGEVAEATIELTKNVDRTVLQESKFLMDPEVALMKYVDNVTKRVEFNRTTKDENGKDLLGPLLDELDAVDRELAESAINAMVGNVTHLSPFWRKTNSYLATMNLVTLLPFATLASIPDFAGSIVATREFKGVGMAFKEIVNQIQDREAAKRLANDIGVVMPESAANAWMSQADSDMLDPTARLATDKFFQWTGLQALTNISRQFATGMSKQFLIEHAYHPNDRSARYLEQLGVTAEQVRAWNDRGQVFATEEGQAVKAAMTRFVESSVLRPGAGERPIWASDPRFALVWQLKSFVYSFNKVILEGVGREVGKRIQAGESTVAAMAPLLVLTMAAFMPLAALGLELREYAKVGLSYALPGIEGSTRYFKSDHMDYGTYFSELFSRAGLDGPIGMLTMAQRSGDWGGSALATLLGPTAELVDKILRDGPIDGAYSRMNSPSDQAGIILGIGAVARTVL